MVNKLLDLGLGEGTFGKIALGINVEEGGVAADGHGSAVLLFNRGKVAHVEPLYCLLEVASRTSKLQAVNVTELSQLTEGANLLRELFAVTNGLLVHGLMRTGFFGLLFLDKRIDTVKGDAAVIADDAATAVCIRKTGDNVGMTAGTHLIRVDVKDTGVVGLAAVGIEVNDFGVNFIAVSFAGGHGHTDASVNHKGTLQRLVRLKADDLLERLIDIACFVRGDGGDHLGVHINDPAVCRLLCKEIHDIGPKLGGCFGGAGQKRLVTFVGGIVFLDEIADINSVVPVTVGKVTPCD